jgi:hypothetical protein
MVERQHGDAGGAAGGSGKRRHRAAQHVQIGIEAREHAGGGFGADPQGGHGSDGPGDL